MQYASKAPASRLDVINLQEALDEKLMERQAREMGVCPVREDLYSQCFGTRRTCLPTHQLLQRLCCCLTLVC